MTTSSDHDTSDLVATDDECLNPAATMLTGDVRGEDDHQSMGTLYVYDTDASLDDNLGAVTILGGANEWGCSF